MNPRIQGFRGEFLWELDVAQTQLLALADAMPAQNYPWRPAADARSFSAVLVHVAAGNLLLLRLAGFPAHAAFDLYGTLLGDPEAQLAAAIRMNLDLEESMLEKAVAINFLQCAFDEVRWAIASADDGDLDRIDEFFGEKTTVRRVLLRILAHCHEHMGQAIAYLRSNGIQAPWPDPLRHFEHRNAEPRAINGTPQPSLP